MIPFILAAAYVLAVGSCGFLASRLLRIDSVYAETGMTFVFGTSVFLLLGNALGYVLPIRFAFMLCFALIVVFDLVAFALIRAIPRSATVSVHDRRGAVFLFALTLLVGFAGARYVGSDPWSWQHFPLASTIIHGNFPVHSPIDPERLLRYHYAPAFLAAGFTILTRAPLSVGFALQPLIGAAGILFFGAAFVRQHRRTRTALIAAVLALAGSGLVWMKGPELLHLGRAFVGLDPLRPALAGLADLVGTPITTSPLVFLGHRSTATGFPLLYGFLVLLSVYLGASRTKDRVALGAVLFVFALALTLTMEIAFVTLAAACVLTCALFLPLRRTAGNGIRVFVLGLTCLIPALLVAFVHGGVLSGLLDGGHGSFMFHPSLSVTYDTYGNTAFMFGLRFLRDFGIPLFLFPAVLVLAWGNREREPVFLIATVLALLHFVIPFLVDYGLIRGEMHRVFYGATSLMAMLAGVFVADVFLDAQFRARRVVGVTLVVMMLVSGALYLALRLVIPTMRLVPSPLFAGMPSVTREQAALYDWVRSNTSMRDYFYARNLTVHFETITDEATVQMRDRILFTTYTGRYTVGPIIYWDYDPVWLGLVKTAEETCGKDSMRRLHVRYLLVESPDRASWYARTCRAGDWKLVYGNGNHLPKVYELR